MVRLPVSGLEAAPRLPDGADELAMREMTGSPVARAIVLAERLAGPGDWGGLTVTDFETLMLAIRTQVWGEEIDLGLTCPGCRSRIEIAFSVDDYTRGPAPRQPAAVTADPDHPGWYLLDEKRFRLPTAADQAAVAGRSDAAAALADRCIAGPRPRAPERTRIERAMSAMSPEVSRPIQGRCPDCGTEVEAPLHVTRLVIAEMVRDGAGLHDDVDLIARAYHWPETDILSLPRPRRQAYAERIRQAARAGA